MCSRSTRTREEDPWAAHGGYMGAKIQKLQNQFSEENVEMRRVSNIFEGVCIFVNGYTEPSFDVLRQIMLDHGGTFEHYYCSRVTHIIAVNLPQSKQHEMESKAFVHPNWLVDCVTARKLLSCAPYKLTKSHSFRLQKMESLLPSSTLDNGDCIIVPTMTKDLPRPADDRSAKMTTASAEGPALLCPSVPVSKTTESAEQPKTTMASAHEPRFISDFYSNSRLHHISTLGIEFKEFVERLAASRTEFPGLERLRAQFGVRIRPSNLPSSDALSLPTFCEKCFMHIDMDCFFVSVGLRDRPDLIGKPVAVSHSRMGTKAESDLVDCERMTLGHNHSEVKQDLAETHVTADVAVDIDKSDNVQPHEVTHRKKSTRQSMAEIASCNYEARKAGVRNGMLMGRAVELCPELVVIPYDFKSYSQVATLMYETVASYTVLMQAVSCDEVYVDCTTIVKEIDVNPEQLAAALRKDIYNTTQCTASVGIGPNMLVARLANTKAKPNGVYHVLQSQVAAFMEAQYVRDIPGVGYSLENRLSKQNVVTCGDLQRLTMEYLQAEFGAKTGRRLYMFARGDDDCQLKVAQKRQSVSAEINYGIRLKKSAEAISFLRELSKEVCARLKKAGFMGSRLTLKMKVRRKDAPVKTAKYMGHGICDTMSKACQLRSATDDYEVISKECCRMYTAMGIAACDLRGVGIVIQRLVNSREMVDPACRPMLGPLPTALALLTERACTSDNRRVNFVEKPSFCGYTDIEDVKVVVKEWINKPCSGPHMRDENMVVKFLVDLIETKDMDAAFYLTSYLFQQMTKSLNEEWDQCYYRIWESVQARVNEEYGGILKLPQGPARAFARHLP